MSVVYKILWIAFHTLFDVLEKIFYFGIEFREKSANFIKKVTQDSGKKNRISDRFLIESQTNHLKKLPRHLAVILSVNNEQDVDLGKLSKLVEWSLVSGISFISFYDSRGILKNQLCKSFEQAVRSIEVNESSEKIVWGANYLKSDGNGTSSIPHRNGYRKFIVVNLFSLDDCQSQFKNMMTEDLIMEKSENFTCNLIDEKLGKYCGHLPDPDLALYFGTACCTQGFLPWQIRLTEFLQLSYKLNSISAQKYLQTIYKFGVCQQRFGK